MEHIIWPCGDIWLFNIRMLPTDIPFHLSLRINYILDTAIYILNLILI